MSDQYNGRADGSYSAADSTPAQQPGAGDRQRSASAPSDAQQYGQAQYGQPQYGQAPYGQPPYQQGYPSYLKTNTLSIVAIILGFLVPPGGIICGHIALGQIKRTGEGGRPLALTGLIAGYAITGIYVLFFLFYILAIVAVIGGVAGSSSAGVST